MSEKKWVRQSLRNLSNQRDKQGYQATRSTVRRLLKKLGFGLYSNRKSISPNQHPERDRQFRYINKLKSRFLKAGYLVISIDTKKKELIGHFANRGQAWARQAKRVNAHDFPSDAIGRAVPYGIYESFAITPLGPQSGIPWNLGSSAILVSTGPVNHCIRLTRRWVLSVRPRPQPA